MAVIKINQPPSSNPDPALSPCAACSVRDLSICGVLDNTDLQRMAVIAQNMSYSAQDPIIDEGEAADFLFNITSGTVRLYKLLPDGRRQITGFLGAGNFLGIALNETYAYSAEAVNDVTVCRFQRPRLEALLDELPHLEKRLLGLASNELAQAQDQMVLLGRKTAKEKLVTFLLALSKRQEAVGSAPSPVDLPMSRSDIADYLGLTTETVSRTFSNLKRSQTIRIEQGGVVALPDFEALEAIAEGY